MAAAEKSETADWEHAMTTIYRPLILHAMGNTEEAKRMFLESSKTIRLWDDHAEPLRGSTSPDGIELAVYLSYKEAAKVFGVETLK